MGTLATLVAWDVDPLEFAGYVAFARSILDDLEANLSVFNSASEISALNRSAGGAPVHVSPRTREVLELSIKYSEQSDGYFDITVAPLVKAWGFAGGKPPAKPLDAATIRDALKTVGYRHILLSNNTARLDAAGVSVNLGGIAKGYAIDVCYAELLRQFKPKSIMLDLGGNIRCGGSALSDRTRIIGIKNPFERDSLVGSIRLGDGMAIGTSGNYEQFFMIGDRRYNHIIDPRTGIPVTGMASVTVLSTNAVDTEGLSKPLFILGPERSKSLLAARPWCQALFILDRQPVVLYVTPGFKALFTPEPRFAESVVELKLNETETGSKQEESP